MQTTSDRLIERLTYARALYCHWRRQGRLKEQDFTHLMRHLASLAETIPPHARAPLSEGAARELDEFQPSPDLLQFAREQLLQVQQQSGLAPLSVQHCLNDWAARWEQAQVTSTPAPPSRPGPPPYQPPGLVPTATAPPVSLIQRLLDPRSLQILMAASGGVLVLGMIVWLWSVGVFEEPLTVAFALGGANVALLGVGAWLVRYTRHAIAGRAVTLLACLLMPLHLWYYDAQGLITLSEGGHLWIPALVCCGIYAAIARLLKDSLFVYTLVGGISLTGLLILADQNIDRLSEFAAPATLLVVIGLVSLHVERLFAPVDGPFSRHNFGKAFFRAGHAVVVAGLGVLAFGRMLGWSAHLFPQSFAQGLPDVASQDGAKFTALLLTLAATYGYLYSQFVVDRLGKYFYAAVATGLWSEWILLDILNIEFSAASVALVLGANALAVHAAAYWMNRRGDEWQSIVRGAQLLAATLTSGALVTSLGAWLVSFLVGPFAFEPNLLGVAALVVTSLACLAGWLALPATPENSLRQFFGATFLMPLAAAALVLVQFLGLSELSLALPIAMLIPASVALVARFGLANHRLIPSAAYGAAFLLLAVALATVSALPALPAPSLAWAATFGLAALVFGLASQPGREQLATTASLLLASASASQLCHLAGAGEYSPIMGATLVGLAGWIAARLATQSRTEISAARQAWLDASTVAIAVGGLAGMLLAANRVFGGEATWHLLPMSGGLSAVALLVAAFSRDRARRSGMVALAIGEAAAGLLVINALADLTLFQRGEILVTLSGLAVLVAAHLGWRKEGSVADPAVTTSLTMGSMMAIAPAMFELVMLRTGFQQSGEVWRLAHETGGLALALGLLAAGLLCRIRATTIAGATGLAVYILSLVVLVDIPDQLQSVAVTMMVGGGVLFAGAVLLSIYRDRLLAIPEKVRSGEGVFCVLKWR